MQRRGLHLKLTATLRRLAKAAHAESLREQNNIFSSFSEK